jgi:plasmid stability protein
LANLSVKDVPEEIAERLRRRAARNHRSLQGELMAIIEQAARDVDGAPPRSAPAPAQQVGEGWGGRAIVRRGGKPIEQIAAEHRARFPSPIDAGPLGVDIIRADRDAR